MRRCPLPAIVDDPRCRPYACSLSSTSQHLERDACLHMPRTLFAASTYNEAQRRVIFSNSESCMTDPSRRRRSLGSPRIHRRSDSKSPPWSGASGRCKIGEWEGSPFTSIEARGRSCEFGACAQRWSMSEGSLSILAARRACVAHSDGTTHAWRRPAIFGIVTFGVYQVLYSRYVSSMYQVGVSGVLCSTVRVCGRI